MPRTLSGAVSAKPVDQQLVRPFGQLLKQPALTGQLHALGLGPADQLYATYATFFERAGMEDTKLGAMENKDDPAEVARQGFQALMAGRDHVVARGLKSKVQVACATVRPERSTV